MSHASDLAALDARYADALAREQAALEEVHRLHFAARVDDDARYDAAAAHDAALAGVAALERLRAPILAAMAAEERAAAEERRRQARPEAARLAAVEHDACRTYVAARAARLAYCRAHDLDDGTLRYEDGSTPGSIAREHGVAW